MNAQQLEYVHHLFPNPSTVSLRFVSSSDHLSLVVNQQIGILFFHYKGKSVNILDALVMREIDQVRIIHSELEDHDRF